MSNESKDISSQNARKIADKWGCMVVLPLENEIQVDIDSEENYRTFISQLPILSEYVPVTATKELPSRSGKPGRRHITVTVGRTLTEVERILLQSTLGSDPKRELLSYARTLNSDPHPTLFFERK